MLLHNFQCRECKVVFNPGLDHYTAYSALHITLSIISFILQGFMEDEGRQRTTKYIGHKCVSVYENIFPF